jgi:hypothetical protein
VTFARASGAEEQGIFAPSDECGGGQIENQTAIHFRIEGEVEVVERPVGVAEPGLFAAPVQQTVGASREFIGNQTGD